MADLSDGEMGDVGGGGNASVGGFELGFNRAGDGAEGGGGEVGACGFESVGQPLTGEVALGAAGGADYEAGELGALVGGEAEAAGLALAAAAYRFVGLAGLDDFGVEVAAMGAAHAGPL